MCHLDASNAGSAAARREPIKLPTAFLCRREDKAGKPLVTKPERMAPPEGRTFGRRLFKKLEIRELQMAGRRCLSGPGAWDSEATQFERFWLLSAPALPRSMTESQAGAHASQPVPQCCPPIAPHGPLASQAGRRWREILTSAVKLH